MIGKLRGRVDEIEDDTVILDVGGVGYSVFASQRTLQNLKIGEAATLIIETHVREDHFHLYGFENAVEREWFRLLTTVQRVGNKVALVIMSSYSPSQLATAILAKDTTAFSRVKGIGAGLAERIVTELKDKVAKMPTSEFSVQSPLPGGKSKVALPEPAITDDVISALVNLGYTRSDAYSAALKVAQGGDKKLDELIRLSLKELARA